MTIKIYDYDDSEGIKWTRFYACKDVANGVYVDLQQPYTIQELEAAVNLFAFKAKNLK